MSGAAPKLEWKLEDLIALIKSFPLISKFPDNLIKELAQASEILEIATNTQILKQGQMNEHLYFLISGTVGIYVDGGRVSQLNALGDLLGEMSVITSNPVGATILAETPVSLLRVDSKIFVEVKGPERDHYLAILYRIYATVLSEKLNRTNQKAKHFEELTVALTATQAELEEANAGLEKKVEERTVRLEQQNAGLQASMNKMEELNNSKRRLFQKLGELNRDHLAPLKTFLDEFRRRHPDETGIDSARSLVFDVQQLVVPLATEYSIEQAMNSKRVLLADSNKKQQLVAKMALGGSGVALETALTVEEGLAKIAAGKFDLILVDHTMLELANASKEKHPNVPIVLMTSDQVPTYLPALKQLSAIPHIVSRDEADRTFTVKNIMTTVTKLLSSDFFGLEKYLGWGVEVKSAPVVNSKSRADVIKTVDDYFAQVGIRRANRDRIHVVLEEMLMNAIYDAPTDANGKPIFNHLPRTEEVILKPEQQGLVRFATDGMLIAVSVQDPFGSLKGSIILKYLEANYSGTAADMNAKEGKGGAGRGLHQIIENSDLVVFNVDPGKKTEAIALFNVEVKEAVNQNPSFHLFIRS